MSHPKCDKHEYATFYDGKCLECLVTKNVALTNGLVQVFNQLRTIRDREGYVKGLMRVENYISEVLDQC